MRDLEHQLQKAFFDWCALQRCAYPDLDKFYAIPNGGQRNKIVAAKLKAEGVKAGILDTHLPVAMRGYIGLWIEFKVKPNKPTPAQLDRIQQLRDDGHRVMVCYDLDAAITEALWYLSMRNGEANGI